MRRVKPIGLGSLLAIAIAIQPAVLGCVPPGGTVIENTPRTVVLVGQFGADGKDCPWISSGGQRTYLLLPSSLTVSIGPAELKDPSGLVVAKAGDAIRVTGALQEGVTACSTTPPFPVDTLERISP